jgi:transposase InsO family protein
MSYILQGLKRDKVLPIVGISKHQYYYKPKGTKQGRKPTQTTHCHQGVVLDSQQLAEMIKEIHKEDEYGYLKTTMQLKQDGLIINKKKVYAIMKDLQLLRPKVKIGTKVYVKYRKVLPQRPLHVLEMDIKFVWTEQYRKHAYVLTVIDTFTRHTLHHMVKYSIKKEDIKQVWTHITEAHLQVYCRPNDPLIIEVRNDNDKRFSANLVREYFAENNLNQVFTHPYTPQENGHIESFHAILGTHLKPYSFWNIQELSQNLILFYEKYNNRRLHTSIACLSPRNFWTLWNKDMITKTENTKERKIKFKLKIPYHEVRQHTGNMEPEGCSLLNILGPTQVGDSNIENTQKIIGTELSSNLRYKISPSAVPCTTKVEPNILYSQ